MFKRVNCSCVGPILVVLYVHQCCRMGTGAVRRLMTAIADHSIENYLSTADVPAMEDCPWLRYGFCRVTLGANEDVFEN